MLAGIGGTAKAVPVEAEGAGVVAAVAGVGMGDWKFFRRDGASVPAEAPAAGAAVATADWKLFRKDGASVSLPVLGAGLLAGSAFAEKAGAWNARNGSAR